MTRTSPVPEASGEAPAAAGPGHPQAADASMRLYSDALLAVAATGREGQVEGGPSANGGCGVSRTPS